MSLRLCVLGSSSAGNAVYVGSERTALLIDAGLAARTTATRLAEIGVPVERLAGICVSHEHADHTAGLRVLHRRHGVPLYANAATIEMIERDPRRRELAWQVFTTGAPFTVGDLRVEPFAVPHDAGDPVGFVVSDGRVEVGIATDMGMPTTLVRAKLRRCRAVVIESNHDAGMLQRSARPWSLKQRILGRQGHLSNERSLELLLDIAGPQLAQVFLAHLSRECNDEVACLADARRALAEAGFGHVRVDLTYPGRVGLVWTAEAAAPAAADPG